MGMGADGHGNAAIGEMRQRLFLARRLGVKVEDDGVGGEAERTGGQFLLDGGERIVHRVHEDAADHAHHQHALALGRLIQPGAAPRRARRIIERPQHMRRAAR